MMTVVVQAHPVPDSLNAALLRRVEAGLVRAEVAHRVFRLGQGERPAMADLDQCRHLVLVYPTWWGGQPAVLLDWLQEAQSDSDHGLASVERLTAVTSLGSSRLVNRVQGEWGRRHLRRTVLSACAPGASFDWVPLYKVDRQPRDVIERHLAGVEQRFAEHRASVGRA